MSSQNTGIAYISGFSASGTLLQFDIKTDIITNYPTTNYPIIISKTSLSDTILTKICYSLFIMS